MSNREEVDEQNLPGLLVDFADILFHETQKTINLIYPRYHYISDEMIIATLTPRVVASKSKKHLAEVQNTFLCASNRLSLAIGVILMLT